MNRPRTPRIGRLTRAFRIHSAINSFVWANRVPVEANTKDGVLKGIIHLKIERTPIVMPQCTGKRLLNSSCAEEVFAKRLFKSGFTGA